MYVLSTEHPSIRYKTIQSTTKTHNYRARERTKQSFGSLLALALQILNNWAGGNNKL